jgi:hypothetical protein
MNTSRLLSVNQGFTLNLEEEAHGFNKWQLGLTYEKVHAFRPE